MCFSWRTSKWPRLQTALTLWLALCPLLVRAQRFYPDDPLEKEPPPIPVQDATTRRLNVYMEMFGHTFSDGRKLAAENGGIPAQAVNTLGEVPDNTWFHNRHSRRRMSLEELRRGPAAEGPPAEGAWTVLAAKPEGVNRGVLIQDGRGRWYYLEVDPFDHPEMTTGAEVIGSKFFYALGYNVPEVHLVYFNPDRLALGRNAFLLTRSGKRRELTALHIKEFLRLAPREPAKGYRAAATRVIEAKELGPFRFSGTRSDDPNDIVPHEHRRDLRGLFVFCAWLGHHDMNALSTMDYLVEEGGVRFVRHYLRDFSRVLGSDNVDAKQPRDGYEYLFSWDTAWKRVLSVGLYVPKWARAEFPDLPEVGRFESTMFEPEAFRCRYPLPAFENRQPGDTFWAARQVMAFTDEEIAAIVQTAHYTDPESPQHLVRCLAERRDKIGRAYFSQVLPLDDFRVENNKLLFTDLEVKHGFRSGRDLTVEWFQFDNTSETLTPLRDTDGFSLPESALRSAPGSYSAVKITGETPEKTVMVYLRHESGGFHVVGLEWTPHGP